MSNSEYVKMIRELNLTEYEARCYLALFERESLTVVDVMNLTGIPRPNAYEAMRKLLAKGLCTLIPGKIKRYTSSDPQLLEQRALEISQNALQAELDDHAKRKQEILDKKENILNKVHKILNKIQPLYNDNRNNDSPLDSIEICKDRFQTVSRYNELCKNAREELLTIEKPIGTWIPPTEEYSKLVHDGTNNVISLVKKGVKVRGVYELSDESEPERRKYQIQFVSSCYEAGEDLRIAKEVPLRVATIDSKIVSIAMEDQYSQKPAFASQVIYHQGMAKAFKLLFETLWAGAEDFNDFINREKQKRKG